MRVGYGVIAGMLFVVPALAQTTGNAVPHASGPQEPSQAAMDRSTAQLDMQRAQKDAQEAQRYAGKKGPLYPQYKADQFRSDSRIEANDAKMHEQEVAEAEQSGRH